MGPMNLDYDFRDIFRAPRLALSGKKIWIFIVGNLGGFILYWISSYLSISLSGISFSIALAEYGLYPCLYGNEAEWYSWLMYYAGILSLVLPPSNSKTGLFFNLPIKSQIPKSIAEIPIIPIPFLPQAIVLLYILSHK